MDSGDILALLRQMGHERPDEIYVVGGTVRDGLLGRPFADVDLALPAADTEALARGLAATLSGKVVPLGDRARTWRVALPSVEPGIRYVDCAPMHGDLVQDLLRRDFTVNAMAVPLEKMDGGMFPPAEVIDPLGGRDDLDRRLIRMVSSTNLELDPIRLLRGVRLAVELRFSLEAATREATIRLAPEIRKTAGERVREELCRILDAEGTVIGLELLDSVALLDEVLPELSPCKGVEQPKEHHWEVFTHQMESVAAVEVLMERRVPGSLADRVFLGEALRLAPWHPALNGYFDGRIGTLRRSTLLKLACLVHDVGKPQTKAVQPDGRTRFFGHSEVGADLVAQRLAGLRFSERQVRMVRTMVEEHLRPGQWSGGGLPTARALYRYFRDLGDVAVDTIFLNLADHLAARGPALELQRWSAHAEMAQYALDRFFQQEEREAEPRLVTGHDLIQALALEPGRTVGALLQVIDEAWKTGEVSTKEEALKLADRELRRVVSGYH